MTRAEIDAAATNGTIVQHALYAVTDEGRIAVGVSASAYVAFAKEGEVAPPVPVDLVAQPVNVSPAAGAADVPRTTTLVGSAYISSTGIAQGAVWAQVSATNDFSGALLYDSGECPAGTAVSIPSGTLSSGAAVHWRIAYKNALGQWGEWSIPTAFTTRMVSTMTGGTLTTSGGYHINTFMASESIVVPEDMVADILVVAGGGSGGNGVGGGGGGGGVQYRLAHTLAAGTYAVTVGAGGAASVGNTARGNNGNSSALGAIVTALGGGGGAGNDTSALVGGSGGGGGSQSTVAAVGTAGQGFAGGTGNTGGGGGGGGGGAAGGGFVGGPAGAGGAGFACAISPAATHYAGGGGGGAQSGYATVGGAGGIGGGGAGAMTAGAAGAANTGGGGGAGGYNGAFFVGGAGGSGVVIVRYPY